jgi:hypothetical protein
MAGRICICICELGRGEPADMLGYVWGMQPRKKYEGEYAKK